MYVCMYVCMYIQKCSLKQSYILVQAKHTWWRWRGERERDLSFFPCWSRSDIELHCEFPGVFFSLRNLKILSTLRAESPLGLAVDLILVDDASIVDIPILWTQLTEPNPMRSLYKNEDQSLPRTTIFTMIKQSSPIQHLKFTKQSTIIFDQSPGPRPTKNQVLWPVVTFLANGPCEAEEYSTTAARAEGS